MLYTYIDYTPEMETTIDSWIDNDSSYYNGFEDGFASFYEYWVNDANNTLGENFWAKMICESNHQIGVVVLALADGVLLFSEMLIDPAKRGNGIGTAVIREILENTNTILRITFNHAEACIFPSNVPSQKAFAKAGFCLDTTDPDGYNWRYTIPHRMTLVPSAFQKIASGTKTIELRLNDPKRQRIAVGDHIVFRNLETDERLKVVVRALHIFASFEELYKTLPLDRCGYTKEEVPRAHPDDMHAYYTDDQIKRYGVLGIEIQCV